MPVAKNTANQKAGVLGSGVMASPAEKGDASVDVDKRLYSGETVKSSMKNYSGTPVMECEIFPASERDYTVADAINYQYNQQFTIKLADIMNGNYDNIKLRDLNAPIPQAFIDSLEQNGSETDGYDSARTDFYLKGLSDTAALEHSVDYLASGYAVAKQHIETSFTGETGADSFEQLDTAFKSAIQKVADRTAAELGGFFEQNGVSGETDKIRNSVLKAYNSAVEQYSAYLADNEDYAQLDGTKDEWLKQDDSYMACQLRKAAGQDVAPASEEGLYSLADLEKTQVMVNEVQNCGSGADDNLGINWYDDEEAIGFKLAGLSLKGEVFEQYSGVAEGLKSAMKKSIDNFVNTATDKLNEQLAQARAKVAEPEKMADLNKSEIFVVYNQVMNTYKATGNMIKALQDGAACGQERHLSKLADPQYSELVRYGQTGSIYWNNFFQNTWQYQQNGLTVTPSNGYINQKSGIEALADSWNSFTAQFSNADSLRFNVNNFVAYA